MPSSWGVRVMLSVDDTMMSDLRATNLVLKWLKKSLKPVDMAVS